MSTDSSRSSLRIPISVNDARIFEDSTPILKKARPDWFNLPDEKGDTTVGENNNNEIQMKVFSGGITNKLVGFYIEKDHDDIVIVKLYGEKTDMLIDREKEVRTMELLHEKKCGPQLYAIFENGIAYEYSPGKTLNVVSCRDETVYPLVAKEMARMHSSIPIETSSENNSDHNDKQQSPPSTSTSAIWKMLKNFNNLVQEVFNINPVLKNKLEKLGITESWCSSAIEELENLCNQETNMPVVFCHNDLLLGNIIFNEKKNKISFIDFEYAAPNYAPFDIANHFNEFSGVDDADFSLCPNEEFMRKWLVHYLQNFSTNAPGLESTTTSEQQLNVDVFLRWVQLCQPVSHLAWILWSIYQACHSQIDFDFVHYISLRLPEYNKEMEVIQSQRNNS